ncbi:hypothetical protein ONZ45_g17925 [Pleurotus djamor]|nr:hypothetical protein ONZ45_g17925 [Pleurotus djamor]
MGDTIGADASLPIIEDWLLECNEKHSFCLPHTDGGTYFPSRALDVSDALLGIVYLRDRKDIIARATSSSGDSDDTGATIYPPYLSLSHRWGDPALILQLLSETENKFRTGIQLGEMPPTFRDAALLVKRLGYQYLWIDSLCIFQDSAQDWQKEAQSMADVYSHSLCNISAIAASFEPTEGLFCRRKMSPQLLFPFRLRAEYVWSQDEGPWIVSNDSTFDDDIEDTPLSTRGWVVQERFLARRVLHFTRNQFYWECLDHLRCEADPHGVLLLLNNDRTSRRTIFQTARRDLAQYGTTVPGNSPFYVSDYDAQSSWCKIVSTYANCMLTKEKDRLIAMSGIAKAFSGVVGSTYLAGLWENRMEIDLAWTTQATADKQVCRSAYAPTWSWASVVGGKIQLSIGGARGNLPTPLIRVVESRVVPDPPDGDFMGSLSSAELTIECILHYYHWNGKLREFAVFKDEAKTDRMIHVSHVDLSQLHLDTTELTSRFDEGVVEGVCMPLFGMYIGRGGGENTFLLLQDAPEGKFARVGLYLHSQIGNWIETWSGSGTRITLV